MDEQGLMNKPAQHSALAAGKDEVTSNDQSDTISALPADLDPFTVTDEDISLRVSPVSLSREAQRVSFICKGSSFTEVLCTSAIEPLLCLIFRLLRAAGV